MYCAVQVSGLYRSTHHSCINFCILQIYLNPKPGFHIFTNFEVRTFREDILQSKISHFIDSKSCFYVWSLSWTPSICQSSIISLTVSVRWKEIVKDFWEQLTIMAQAWHKPEHAVQQCQCSESKIVLHFNALRDWQAIKRVLPESCRRAKHPHHQTRQRLRWNVWRDQEKAFKPEIPWQTIKHCGGTAWYWLPNLSVVMISYKKWLVGIKKIED